MGQSVGTNGQHLEERYFLQKVKLGQGSFGTVWRAVDRKTGDTVAIKQLDKASLPKRGVTRQDIEREIAMMKACSHVNITQLFDHFEDDISIYLALEYCDGGDFGDKVKERGLAASEAEVAEWSRQMCAAVSSLHGLAICHRDIKPDNFMVAGGSTIKLSDFGLAIHLPKGTLLQVKCGTPAFMSPEQHKLPRNSAGYSFPCDVWAVGVSLYMMMFGGKHPFLNDRGGLDDSLLLTGELDFRDSSSSSKLGGFFGGFAGLGATPLRFSEDCRSLCKRMVEPDPGRRITAEDANNLRWLQSGVGAAAARQQSRQNGARSSTPPISTPEPGRGAQRSSSPSRTPQLARSPDGSPSTDLRGFNGSEARNRARTPPMGDFRYDPKARSSTPPVNEDPQMAARELARLETEKKELEERQEQMKKEQERLELQKKLFRQQTKELENQTRMLEEIEERKRMEEQGLQQLLEQKKRVESEMAKRAAIAARAGGSSGSAAASTPAPPARSRTAPGSALASASPSTPLGGRGKLLRQGTRCRYESGTYGWMPAVVQNYNESDGTYNLDVRQHAQADKISPITEASTPEAWPAGTMASYLSASVNQWLPAVVTSYNEHDGTYNLDVRDHADVDRIRARGDPEDTGAAGGAAGRTAMAAQASDPASSSRPSRSGGGRDANKTSLDNDWEPTRIGRHATTAMEATSSVTPGGASSGGSPSAPPHFVGKGDVCTIPEHGLVVIDGNRGDGRYTVKAGDKSRVPVQAEVMRAPREAKFAWAAGTKVSYLSASLGKWIDATIESFNSSSGTYNLDVRPEADPDKVRPRW